MAANSISVEEAGRDFAKVMERVKVGEEVVIEDGGEPVAIIRSTPPKDSSIEATLARLRARSEARGYKALMDEDFAADMEQIVRNRKPRDTSAWD